MSRTFRRKNYEFTDQSSWKNRGRKTFGYYTETNRASYYERLETYREPTKLEFFKKYWKIHSDGDRNRWTPSRDYRHPRIVQNRRINDAELFRCVKNLDHYEPLFEERPRDCDWDWY